MKSSPGVSLGGNETIGGERSGEGHKHGSGTERVGSRVYLPLHGRGRGW